MRPFMLHRSVERARNYLLLLRARELVKIHRVAGDAHREVRIFFRAVHRFAQALPVKHVDVQVVRTLCEVAVEQRRDVCAALFVVVAQSLRYD